MRRSSSDRVADVTGLLLCTGTGRWPWNDDGCNAGNHPSEQISESLSRSVILAEKCCSAKLLAFIGTRWYLTPPDSAAVSARVYAASGVLSEGVAAVQMVAIDQSGDLIAITKAKSRIAVDSSPG